MLIKQLETRNITVSMINAEKKNEQRQTKLCIRFVSKSLSRLTVAPTNSHPKLREELTVHEVERRRIDLHLSPWPLPLFLRAALRERRDLQKCGALRY